MTEKQNRMILITLPGDFSGYYSQCSNRGPGTHGEALPLDMYTFARTRPHFPERVQLPIRCVREGAGSGPRQVLD